MRVILHNTIVLNLRNLRALEGVFGKRISDFGFGGSGFEGFDELIVDFFLNVDSSSSSARLAFQRSD